MALVRMSALMIENQLFSAAFEDAITIRFHARPEFIGTLMEGIASFSPGGRFLAANRNGLFQLGLSTAALQSHTFSSLFGLPVSALFDHYRTASPGLLNLCMHNGVSVYGRAQLRLSNSVYQQTLTTDRATPAAAPAPMSASQAASSARRLSGLRYLRTGDQQLELVVEKVTRVLGKDNPIMIMGETGTGKELLAQAIHNDSPRAMSPFVAVNCASIPETLIESELFGYEDGAFTGARKKGAPGKILQANGGTLFLDEIGDMPKHLQARLLRVLKESKVSPLGSGKEVEVDVTVISATHKNLKELIARGDFREDLYYRLNGLVVRLPALRERSDFDAVVKKVLQSLCESCTHITIAPEVMALLQAYHWPGNVRQLHNLLRTASVMVDEDCTVRMEHLPDDFLDELRAPLRPLSSPMPTGLLAAEPPTMVPSVGAQPEATAEDPGEDGKRLQAVTLKAMAQMLRLHKGNL